MARLDTWSTTAASNNSAAPDGYPEGMKASDFNNGMRETMAQVRTAWEENDWRNFYGATTATYQSATTFDIDDEYQTEFTVGRRFRAGIPDGTWVYGRVVSESTSVGVTTVTVAMDTGDAIDANLDTIYLAKDARSIGPGAGVLDTVPGSAAAPGLIFGGVADVGLYSPGSTSMAGAADGAVQFLLAGSEDYNFRVAGPFFLADTPITTGGAFESHSFHAAQPLAWLQKGVSGSAWTPGTAAEFILESDAAVSVGIVTPNTLTGSLFFGDSDDEDVGGFTYDHSANTLVARTGGATAWTADSDGDLIVRGTVDAAVGSTSQPAYEFANASTGLYYESSTFSIRQSINNTAMLAMGYSGQIELQSHELWVAPSGFWSDTKIVGGQDASAIMFEVRPYNNGNTMRVSGGDASGESSPAYIDWFGQDHATRDGDIDMNAGTGGALSFQIDTVEKMAITSSGFAFGDLVTFEGAVVAESTFQLKGSGASNGVGLTLNHRDGAGTDGDPEGGFLVGEDAAGADSTSNALRWAAHSEKWYLGSAVYADTKDIITRAELDAGSMRLRNKINANTTPVPSDIKNGDMMENVGTEGFAYDASWGFADTITNGELLIYYAADNVMYRLPLVERSTTLP